MKSNENRVVTIDLCNALNATAYNDENLLQIQAVEKLNYLLNKFKSETLKKSVNNEWEIEFNPSRYNNTIFVSGQRGAGKTTFLRSVLSKFNIPDNDIKPIAFIDPTLVEVHEHILVQIIAKIKVAVSKAMTSGSDESKRFEFQNCLEDMAEGLKLLGSHVEKTPQDPAFFLSKALKHAVGGQSLEIKFHKLIDKAVEILGVKLLIIAFDDVDTNTNEAFNVLELIRKYLTSQKLVVLISGDPSLYSYIIQGQRAKELNNGYSEIKGMDELSKNLPGMVRHLEQQYLSKVLPVEYRIELKNLAALIESNINIKLKLEKNSSDNNKNTNPNIIYYIRKIVSNSLKINTRDIESYVSFILEQPIRTVLQILKVTNESFNLQSGALFIALRDSYIGDLRKENISIESLSEQSMHPHLIGYLLFKLCADYGELETGFYARPDGTSSSYNSSMFILSNVISNYCNKEEITFCESTARFIQIMLAGPASSTIFMNNAPQFWSVNNKFYYEITEYESYLKDYVDYIGINKKQNSFSLASHFSPFILNSTGVIQISKSNFDLRKMQFKAQNGNSLKPNYTSQFSIAAIILGSHSISTKGGEIDCFSIYSLLSSISELLLCKNESDIKERLWKGTNIPTYGHPNFDYKKIEDAEISNSEIERIGGSNASNKIMPSIKEMSSALLQWIENSKDSNSHFSSLLIGKIWTRTYYSLSRFSTGKLSDTKSFRKHMERFIWIIINSVLIEEARYAFRTDTKAIRALSLAKNVIYSSDELTSNLYNINNSHLFNINMRQRKLPLTYLMATCPLFYSFLITNEIGKSKKSQFFIELKKFIHGYNDSIPNYLIKLEDISQIDFEL